MNTDFEKLGAPKWFSIFGGGFAVACAFAVGLATYLSQANAERLQLRTEERDVARLYVVEHQQRTLALQTQVNELRIAVQQVPSAQQLTELSQKSQQLRTWNEAWAQQNRQLKAQADLSGQLASLRNQHSQVSARAVRYTNGFCNDAYNLTGCDLSAVFQRQLKAIEAERDQLQAQLLELLARIAPIN